MKKLLILLLLISLFSCKQISEPDSFTPTTSSNKQEIYYIKPISDNKGNMVLPLNTNTGIITTDSYKSKFMHQAFEECVIYYHKLLDPSHNYDNINNLKTINDNYANGPIKVDEELLNIIKLAIKYSKETNGYFNPTIGNLSNLWKPLFTNNHINNDPNIESIKNSLTASLNIDQLDEYILIDDVNSTIELKKIDNTNQNIILDLGAFSKGYVLDKCYERLLKYKAGFLLSAGGSSIVTYIEPSQKDLHWNIGIKNPNTGEEAFQINIDNSFISSSGDEQQYFINEEGIRRHHILNPFTGYPENNYRSITLISNTNGSLLDVLTTALYNIDINNINSSIRNIEEKNNITIEKALIYENNNKELILNYDNKMNEYISNITNSIFIDIIINND